MSRPCHICFPLIVTWCLNHDILLEYESHWLIFLTWGMIMTTALQFSVYDMCHCYNNLNSTHTLNMIVYFCPFGLQFELLQQTQMRWPSWFQDLESYQPMGGGLSLVQLTVVIWCSFARTKLTKPFHQTTCSTMPRAFVTLMAMAASCSRKIPALLGQAYSTGGGFTASATTPCSSDSIIRSSNQS